MKYIKQFTRIICLSYLIVVNISCSVQKKKISIVALTMLSNSRNIEANGKIYHNRSDYYLVENYNDDSQTEQFIDSFASVNKHLDYSQFDDYQIYFFKKSIYTNIEAIKSNKNQLNGYSVDEDYIYNYSWSKGKFAGKIKFVNGKPVGKKVILEKLRDNNY